MLWIIRAGKGSTYYKKFLEDKKIFIPWEGYHFDLSNMKTLASFREVVSQEKGTDNRTSISNWSAQLYSFVDEMQPGDYVLIPARGSRSYALAMITGDYSFSSDERDRLYHCRSIQVLQLNISRTIFPQNIIYSLGAFRTIFKARYEKEILEIIQSYKKQLDENE